MAEAVTSRAVEVRDFSLLPVEVSLMIFEFLTQWEKCQCMLVCRRWYKLCSDQSLWPELDLQIKTLRITGEFLASLAAKWPAVHSLSFEFSRWPETKNPEQKAKGLPLDTCTDTGKTFQQLEMITFINCNLDAVSPQALRILVASTNGRLTSLRCKLVPALDVKHLASILQPAELSLDKYGCTDNTVIVLPDSVMRRLKVLDMSNCNWSNESFERFFEALRLAQALPSTKEPDSVTLSGLEKICLNGCSRLQDEGVIKLANSFPFLKEVDLSWCWDVTNEGIDSLAENCPKVTSLKLAGKFYYSFPCVRTYFPKLRYLDLTQIFWMDEPHLLLRIQEARPSLKIINYHGNEF